MVCAVPQAGDDKGEEQSSAQRMERQITGALVFERAIGRLAQRIRDREDEEEARQKQRETKVLDTNKLQTTGSIR